MVCNLEDFRYFFECFIFHDLNVISYCKISVLHGGVEVRCA